MAVSNRGLVLMALVAVGLGSWNMMDVASSVVQGRRRSATEQVAVRALRDSVHALGLQVRTAAVRDRVDSAVASYGSESTPEVIVIGHEAPAAAAVAESLFATVPAPPNPAYRWRFVTVESPSTPRWPGGTLTSFAILPSARTADVCTTVAIVFPRDSTLTTYERKYWRDTPFDGAAGPCWFLARFGAPGPEVKAWLDARYWDVAAGVPPHDRPLVYSSRDLAGAGVLDRVFGNVAVNFYRESVTLEGCAGRRPELCGEYFLRTKYPPGLLPDGIVGNDGFTNNLYYRSEGYASMGGTLGVPRAASQALLAMMVDDLGPVRFAEFWASPAPVAEAFESVAGMSLGDWYRMQLRSQMAEAGISQPREATSWPSALGILALALGTVLWRAGRRQVR